MAPELVEAIAAGVVGATVLFLVGQPFWDARPQAPAPWEPPDPEETPRGQALLALREIEFDRATGKLSEADFAALHARYSARALALLDTEPDAAAADAVRDPVEQLIQAHAASRELLTDDGRCAGCGAMVPMDGRFCPGCGRAVRPGA